MDASIIVLTKNGGNNFPKLLERLFSQEYAPGFEVIVVDSGSTDGTVEEARKYPVHLEIIEPGEFHHGKTRNLGAGLARGKYLVYITQDALPVNNRWLQRLTDNFSDPETAMVVGRQIPWENTKPPERFFYYYNFPDFRITVKSNAVDYYHDNVFISNVNSAIRRDVWQKYRFSESIVMAEDKEIAIRLLIDSFSILYEPGAVVFHGHNMGLKQAFERSFDYGISLRQGVNNLPKSRKGMSLRFWEYFRAELSYIRQNRLWRWAPYCLGYEITKYSGLFFGKIGWFKRPILEE